MLEPLRIHCGVVLHPARHPKSHHSTQDRVTVSPRGGPQFTEESFRRHHFRRRAEDEKTSSKVRQENLW